MADNVVFRSGSGTPQYPKTQSNCVYDPVSGIPIKTQIDKMAKDIAELKESGITINAKENIRVANTMTNVSGEDCYYTRMSAGRKYQVAVDITGDYSRIGVTTNVPDKNVDVLGYQVGGKSTKNYRVYISMDGQGKIVNLTSQKETTFTVNPTDDFYLAISFKRDMVQSFDITYVKDEEEDTGDKGGYLSIDKQFENIAWMRNKHNATTLLWITDAHAISADKRWTPQLEKALRFATEHNANIDDILHTGDIVKANSADWDDDLWINLGAERVLNVVGNHDVLNSSNSAEVPVADTYARYFAPYIANWGVTHDGNTSHCFYYKDYANGIRLIVLDQQTSSIASAQLTWLQGVLADARTNDKHVVVAGHYQPDDTAVKIPSAFTSTKTNFGFRNSSSYLDAIDDFIEAGGIFVCWLVGHTHTDFLTKIPSHHNQLVICQDCLACRIDTTADRNRQTNTDSELCMNVISFCTDISNSHFRTITISRVGVEFDMFNRHRGSICIDYDSGEIVGEW